MASLAIGWIGAPMIAPVLCASVAALALALHRGASLATSTGPRARRPSSLSSLSPGSTLREVDMVEPVASTCLARRSISNPEEARRWRTKAISTSSWD
jgi:hypothetical protein